MSGENGQIRGSKSGDTKGNSGQPSAKQISVKLFEPSEEWFDDYPELAEIKEFRNVSEPVLRTIWYLYNKTSPLYKEEKNKISRAVNMGFALEDLKESNEEQLRVINLAQDEKWEGEELAAVERMKRFSVKVRTRFYFMLGTMISNLERIVESGELAKDVAEGKNYALLVQSVVGSMDKLLVKMENGFGVKVEEEESEPKPFDINTS